MVVKQISRALENLIPGDSCDSMVITLEPEIVSMLDVAIVVTSVKGSNVTDNSIQSIPVMSVGILFKKDDSVVGVAT